MKRRRLSMVPCRTPMEALPRQYITVPFSKLIRSRMITLSHKNKQTTASRFLYTVYSSDTRKFICVIGETVPTHNWQRRSWTNAGTTENDKVRINQSKSTHERNAKTLLTSWLSSPSVDMKNPVPWGFIFGLLLLRYDASKLRTGKPPVEVSRWTR